MSHELKATAAPSAVLYALLLDDSAQVWNGSTFVALNGDDWLSYAIPLAQLDADSGIFAADLPAGLSVQQSFDYLVYQQSGDQPAETDPLAAVGATHAVPIDVYFADIHCARDPRSATPRDEYTLVWFKNGLPVVAGISGATLQVVRRSDGSNLLGPTALTQIATTGAWKLDATGSARQTPGDAVLAVATATIDGQSRTWHKVLGKDSA